MTFNDIQPIILKLGFRSEGLSSLEQYLDALWSANENLNLMSRKMTYEDFLNNHVLDCLLPLKYFPLDVKSVADFGSGGGLPGIIYAIQFPQIKFTLFEKSPRKQEFLLSCKRWVPQMQIEGEINPIKLDKIDLITSRAFKPIDVILELSRDYYKRGGRYFLLKGRSEKINEEYQNALKKFKGLKLISTPLHSPVLDVERTLVSFS